MNGDKPTERIEEQSPTADESIPLQSPGNEVEAETETSPAPSETAPPEGSESAAQEGGGNVEMAFPENGGGDSESAPVLSIEDAQASIEALLYASSDPLSLRDLKKTIPEAGERLRPALDRLREAYAADGRGLQLVEIAGGFQITTRPEYHEVVSRLIQSPKPARLSLQALETLAVIAYRQPVTVPEIMDLRGVRSASVVRTLLEKKLVKIVGRKNVVGRPLMYGTTKEFLLRFGLKDVKDLPQLKDMSEVFGDEVAQQLEVLEGLDAASEQVSLSGEGESTSSSEASEPSDEALAESSTEEETAEPGSSEEELEEEP